MIRLPIKRIILYVFGLVLLSTLVSAWVLGDFLLQPARKGGGNQVVIIMEGLSMKHVAEELERREILAGKTLFILWARVMGYGRKIKAGEYELSAGMTPIQILDKLTKGRIMTHPVTLPEGLTRMQIADLLSEKGLVGRRAFLSLTEDAGIIKKYGLSGRNLEGFLYPDTYQFARGLSPGTVIDVMIRRFLELVAPLEEVLKQSGMSLEQVITLASIVEKETGLAMERPLIASVFLNRLKRGMRLESDPTVIYGLSAFNGNLTRKDLRRLTPYNTYMIRGLPPGPIANPGIAAIKAVLYPAQTKYLYFVSKNDGSHHFSRTFTEHNRAVNYYQKKRGKIPPKTP